MRGVVLFHNRKAFRKRWHLVRNLSPVRGQAFSVSGEESLRQGENRRWDIPGYIGRTAGVQCGSRI